MTTAPASVAGSSNRTSGNGNRRCSATSRSLYRAPQPEPESWGNRRACPQRASHRVRMPEDPDPLELWDLPVPLVEHEERARILEAPQRKPLAHAGDDLGQRRALLDGPLDAPGAGRPTGHPRNAGPRNATASRSFSRLPFWLCSARSLTVPSSRPCSCRLPASQLVPLRCMPSTATTRHPEYSPNDRPDAR